MPLWSLMISTFSDSEGAPVRRIVGVDPTEA
jgi:hypothetical protein